MNIVLMGIVPMDSGGRYLRCLCPVKARFSMRRYDEVYLNGIRPAICSQQSAYFACVIRAGL